jgi:hypothetical protein
MREGVGQPSRRRLTEGRCWSIESTPFDWGKVWVNRVDDVWLRTGVGQPSRQRLTWWKVWVNRVDDVWLSEGVGQRVADVWLREGVAQLSGRRLTDLKKCWRGTFFLQRLQSAHSISKSTKEVFSVERWWFSLNMLPNMVHNKDFCIIA